MSDRLSARDVLGQISDAMICVDRSLSIIFANAAAHRLFDKSTGPGIGIHLSRTLLKSLFAALEGTLDRTLETGEASRVETLDPTSEQYLEVYVSPFDGGLALFFHPLRTRVDQRVDGLNVSIDEIRALADSVSQIVWIIAPSGEVTFLNRRGQVYFGIDPSQPLSWAPKVHPDDLPLMHRSWHKAIESGEQFQEEIRLQRHDDVYRWHLAIALPVFNELGKVSHWCGSSTDIEDLKQIQQDLASREKQSRFIAEASSILSSSLDYESTLQTVAALMVPEMADWCAVDIPDGEGGVKLVAVAHVDPAKVKYARRLREAYPVDLSSPHGLGSVLRGGEAELYAEITNEMIEQSTADPEYLDAIRHIGFRSALVVPLRARGQTLGGLTLVWSESERNYTEKDLTFAEELARRAAVVIDNARLYRDAREAREALESLNESLEARVIERTDALTEANTSLQNEVEQRRIAQRALSRANTLLAHRNRELHDFAYAASHDLQEPLRKILSFAGLMEQEFGSEIDNALPYLHRIKGAASRMTVLIHDLLTYSRVATTGEAFRKVDLSRIAEEVLGDLEVRLSETEGQVEIGELCIVEADPVQMRQLLQNLIGNALKFHRDEIPPVVTVDAHVENGTCILEVSDNGIGFDQQFGERIFAPFQRLHGRGEYPGTGMGLAICRRIAERHDGSITAKGRPNEGSHFVVTLPLDHVVSTSSEGSEGPPDGADDLLSDASSESEAA